MISYDKHCDTSQWIGYRKLILFLSRCLLVKNPYSCISVYISLCTCVWVDISPVCTSSKFCAADNIIDVRKSYMGNQWTPHSHLAANIDKGKKKAIHSTTK